MSSLAPILRRSIVATRAGKFSLRGGSTPPLPAFARSPLPSEKLVEQKDAVWDDGVAPELALDFDAQHVSSREGLFTWLAAFGGLATIFQVIKASDPESKNPAVNRKMNMVKDAPKTGPPSSDE